MPCGRLVIEYLSAIRSNWWSAVCFDNCVICWVSMAIWSSLSLSSLLYFCSISPSRIIQLHVCGPHCKPRLQRHLSFKVDLLPESSHPSSPLTLSSFVTWTAFVVITCSFNELFASSIPIKNDYSPPHNTLNILNTLNTAASSSSKQQQQAAAASSSSSYLPYNLFIHYSFLLYALLE